MNLEVLIFGKLRELAGTAKEVVITEEGTALSDLIRRLGELHGSVFSESLSSTKGLRILINGREYQILNGLKTHLEDKDTVVLLPPIDGG